MLQAAACSPGTTPGCPCMVPQLEKVAHLASQQCWALGAGGKVLCWAMAGGLAWLGLGEPCGAGLRCPPGCPCANAWLSWDYQSAGAAGPAVCHGQVLGELPVL